MNVVRKGKSTAGDYNCADMTTYTRSSLVALVAVAAACCAAQIQVAPAAPGVARTAVSPSPSANVNLVDVVVEDTHAQSTATSLLLQLTEADFRVFDNSKEVPITGFYTGTHYGTRPLLLWFMVRGKNKISYSYDARYLEGKTALLRPALAHLDKGDLVGVAHYRDDGADGVDLEPQADPDAALAKIEDLLKQPSTEAEINPRKLEMARAVHAVIEESRKLPQYTPVLLFLDRDAEGAPTPNATDMYAEIASASGCAFGLNDNGYSFVPERMFNGPEIMFLIHYFAKETGGMVYAISDDKRWSAGLDYMLTQLHFRYTLTFKPPNPDGQRHDLRVELTKAAHERFPHAELRYRKMYVPLKAQP
jgi:hypothetical protein